MVGEQTSELLEIQGCFLISQLAQKLARGRQLCLEL